MSSPRRPFCVRDAGSPPAEALEAVARAALRCDELAEAGLAVEFRRTERGLCAELRTTGGELVRALEPSEALELAGA